MSNRGSTSTRPSPTLEKSFRQAMGNVASPVSVVTAFEDDEPFGTTVSAFNSLSMEPPMILVSLDNTSTLLPRLSVGTRFGLNLLASHQDQIAAVCPEAGTEVRVHPVVHR